MYGVLIKTVITSRMQGTQKRKASSARHARCAQREHRIVLYTYIKNTIKRRLTFTRHVMMNITLGYSVYTNRTFTYHIWNDLDTK